MVCIDALKVGNHVQVKFKDEKSESSVTACILEKSSVHLDLKWWDGTVSNVYWLEADACWSAGSGNAIESIDPLVDASAISVHDGSATQAPKMRKRERMYLKAVACKNLIMLSRSPCNAIEVDAASQKKRVRFDDAVAIHPITPIKHDMSYSPASSFSNIDEPIWDDVTVECFCG